VKLFPCFTLNVFLSIPCKGTGKVVTVHSMNVRGRMEVWCHSFLALALDGGEWSASGHKCFSPRAVGPGACELRLGGSQSWTRCYGEKGNLLPL
jgi:hypothetical protein